MIGIFFVGLCGFAVDGCSGKFDAVGRYSGVDLFLFIHVDDSNGLKRFYMNPK